MGETESNNYVDEMQRGKSNVLVSLFYILHLLTLINVIKVSVRVRPLNRQEIERNFFNIVSVLDEKIVILYDP